MVIWLPGAFPTSPFSTTQTFTHAMKSANEWPTHDFNVHASVPPQVVNLLHSLATSAQLVAGSEVSDMHSTHALRSNAPASVSELTRTRSTSMHACAATTSSAN